MNTAVGKHLKASGLFAMAFMLTLDVIAVISLFLTQKLHLVYAAFLFPHWSPHITEPVRTGAAGITLLFLSLWCFCRTTPLSASESQYLDKLEAELAQPYLGLRMKALYDLEALAQECEAASFLKIVQILCRFIQSRCEIKKTESLSNGLKPPKDVLAALLILAYRHQYHPSVFESQPYLLNLSRCDLRGIDLIGANLSGANLEHSNLSGCFLADCSFEGGNLAGIYLENANLGGCNFVGANLKNAHIQGATFESANLMYASLRQANLSNTNLAHCIGLSESQLQSSLSYKNASLPFGFMTDKRIFKDAV